MSAGPYETELNRIRSLEDWRIPKAASLRTALTSLDSALGAVVESPAWQGSSAEAAHSSLKRLQQNFRTIETYIGQLTETIESANTYRRNTAAAELPSTRIDPFWANVAKVGSVVVHPVLGPLAADKALDAIGDFLGNQREEEAKRIVQQIERDLAPSANSLMAASVTLAKFDPRVAVPAPPKPVQPGSDVPAPDITYPGGGSSPSGSVPGGATPSPGSPGGRGDIGVLNPGGWQPTSPGGWQPTSPGGWHPTNPGEWDPTVPGGEDPSDPSIDSPGGGLLPGGPGGPGGGLPGGSGGPGSLAGGSLPGGGSGGAGGISGIVGGGAGAAAIAASSKIVGVGSMGGLGGAGLGAASGAGLKAGGGLLGNSAFGGAGAGGVGGAGGSGGAAGVRGAGGVGGAAGAGSSGTGASGAAGAGSRSGMGMMGGVGGADEEERKRSGLGGPIAPKLEDEEESGPRAKGASAGCRDEHTA